MGEESHPVAGEWLWNWRKGAIAQAIAHDVPKGEVDWLLQALTPLTRLDLRLNTFRATPTIPLSCAAIDLEDLWAKRVDQRVPLQYLVGHTQWRQFSLTVSPAVLIPRPETELIIDLAVDATTTLPTLRQGHWGDLGTGSGAIALGLASVFPDATVHGVDCSEAALAIAHQNIQRHIPQNIRPNIQGHSQGHLHQPDPPPHRRIHLHQGSWFSPWEPDAHVDSGLAVSSSKQPSMTFSGIVSNPPYIPSDMVLDLQPEVRHHEPHLALDGGKDGLDCVRYLIERASAYLVPNGIFLVELMAGQADTVAALIDRHGGYYSTEICADLAGLDRFVLTRNKPASSKTKLLDA